MFDLTESVVSGCFELQPRVARDTRGHFVKVFHSDAFDSLGLETRFSEEYYSVSCRDVVRGMHFQTPPHAHVKLVYCVQGDVFDAVVDLRVGSPTYRKVASFNLSSEKANAVYIPKGVAHGFCVLSDSAILVYKVSTTYSAAHDAGVLWNSINLDWPVSKPILSERDQAFFPLASFDSPFTLE